MTEYEKRIEKMYKELSIYGCENPHALYAFCIVAINEGYRKANEVIKETAKDITNWLKYRAKGFGDIMRDRLLELCEIINKNYGVEVEQ